MFLFLIFETPRTDNLDLLIRDAHTPSRKYEFDRFLIDSVFFSGVLLYPSKDCLISFFCKKKKGPQRRQLHNTRMKQGDDALFLLGDFTQKNDTKLTTKKGLETNFTPHLVRRRRQRRVIPFG